MIVNCQNCDISFNKKPTNIRRNPNHFCSRSCAAQVNNKGKARNSAKPRTCTRCDSIFYRSQEYPSITRCPSCYKSPISISVMMVENSDYRRSALRRRLIKEKILPYECAICQLEPRWKGKSLSFVLDHINGTHNDHRKENLRWLCPNCNSQTDTFSGRNRPYKNGSGSKI